MKKFRWIIPMIACFVLIFTLCQCEKDNTCKARIKVYYSETGIDTGNVASGVTIEIGKNTNFASFAKATGTTNSEGIFECEFPYEAVLPIDATITKADGMTYSGNTQMTLKPGETVAVDLLIMPH